MLISSKNKNNKIVLGLMTYSFQDGQNHLNECQEIIEKTVEDPDADILLYRQDDQENYIGVLQVEYNRQSNQDQDSLTIIIQRYGVIPSFRDENVAYEMYKALRLKFPQATVIASMHLSDEIAEWSEIFAREM